MLRRIHIGALQLRRQHDDSLAVQRRCVADYQTATSAGAMTADM
jgi:hypothetical protein